jgi:CRISPR-associated protein Csy1
VKAAPASAKARNALAELLAEMGHAEKSRSEYRAIAEQHPGNLKAALGANLVLPQVYQGLEHLEHCRVEYLEGLERLHDLAPRFRFPRGDAALAEARWTNFYLAYQGANDVRPQKRYAEFLQGVLQRSVPEFYAPRPKRAGGGRIRVGFFSHFFYNCTVGRYFASWLTGLDRAKFEVHVYYTNEWVADDTKAIAAGVDHFHHLPGRMLYEVAAQVARDNLDILVYPELGMHAETFTLANLRLAPVQCAGWGHPQTTGHEAIDHFISCELMEPEGAQAHYAERLALLPGLGTRYGKPAGEQKSTRADFGLPEDKTLYLLPQSLFKIHPDNDELVAEVIHRDPDALLVAFASHHDAQTNLYGLRLAKAFERRGLDLATRTRFVMPFVPHASYVRLNTLCDVMLDTLHWSGGNTSLDALASGLPVVSLPGALMRGRQSHAMLTILEAGELIARDTEDYVERAVALGRDRDYRLAISERIVANHGLLFDRDEPLRALERFFEAAVL